VKVWAIKNQFDGRSNQAALLVKIAIAKFAAELL
jgi:hypothetical protein